MRIFLLTLVIIIMSCSTQSNNPLLSRWNTPFEVPPFERIEEKHYAPAFKEAMKRQMAEIQSIVDNAEEPTFENTIAALDYSGSLLRRVGFVFDNLSDANTSEEMQAIAKEMSPLRSKHADDIRLNPQLFQRVKTVYEKRDEEVLTREQQKLLEDTYKSFVRNGANLSDDEKENLRALNEELSLLTLTFGENVLAETNDFKLVIEDQAELDGLPQWLVDQAADAAAENDMNGKWIFTLHKPSWIPFLQYSGNRPLREKLYEDVTVYDVKEADGSHLAVLYMDFHPRPSKRSGAWMTEYRGQYKKDGENVPPIISIVMNFSKPTGDTPSLLTLDEVLTLFHEFGHALHGMLSDCTYPSQAGTNVRRDFVELPSQIMENWAAHPQVIKTYAKHYQTGESIPDELVKKIEQSSSFNQGFITTEIVAASFLDMDYHTVMDTTLIGDIDAFETASMQKIGLIPEIIPRYRSSYFQHIFAGGYSAGYYSYLWAEVLDADAFEAFLETSLFDQETAKAFRENILERGNTEEPMVLYKKFRGHEPEITPLLKRRGLI